MDWRKKMSAIPKTKLTTAEYLEFERKSEERHEYFDGEIFAMSGAKRNHNKIAWQFERSDMAAFERQKL